jgi:SWI/SNF-related matrix-associated actin-dependent regulator of chromatin subfamily A member 5
MKKFTDDAIKFKMDDTAGLYDFDEKDEKGEGKDDFKKIIADNWTEPSRRERKRNYSESDYFKQAMRAGPAPKPREPRIPRMPQLHDFQFFNTQRLTELFEKEVKCLLQAKAAGTGEDVRIIEDVEEGLTEKEMEEKEQLLQEGFQSWARRDFVAFVRACEKYGRNDLKSIASEIEGKTEEEVERYSKVFWMKL